MLQGAGEWGMVIDGSFRGRWGRDQIEWVVAWGKLIVQWWGEEESQRLRVIWYAIGPDGIQLEGIWGLGQSPLRIELSRGGPREDLLLGEIGSQPLPFQRRWLAAQLPIALREISPGCSLHRMATGPNRPLGIPGPYCRAVLQRPGETILALACGPWEDQLAIEGILTSALIWRERYRPSCTAKRPVRELWLIVPKERSTTLWERVAMLTLQDFGCRFRCFEWEVGCHRIRPVEPVSQMSLFGRSPRDLEWPSLRFSSRPPAEHGWHARILSLAPERIQVRYRPGPDWMSYSIHGLEFARVPSGVPEAATFGVVGDPNRERASLEKLSERTFPELCRLVETLLKVRGGTSRNRRHPFYRLRTEAWLESILHHRIVDLDPALDSQHVYSQIPAWRADERSVIDLLTVRRSGADAGRLVVIEIKASEDPQLPLQGLDYWLRVEQARRGGELVARGLFRGVRLVDHPPILYLVAPRLRFHRSFATVGRCLHPEIEAYRLGLNSDWRNGVRVHTIDRLQDL
jgi:hypothetical protein